MTGNRNLSDYLTAAYPFVVTADEEGGYVIEYPDLPGCITQVESIAEVSEAAEEVRALWIETAFDHGIPIPDPSYPPAYSGKFNVRLPRTLHRQLAEAAAREGVSLNQYVVSILSRGIAADQLEQRLTRIEEALAVPFR